MGHVYGECIVEAAVLPWGDEQHDPCRESPTEAFTGRIKIPFKNENIAAIRIPDGDEVGVACPKSRRMSSPSFLT
jgi:hypothetical protein